MVGEKIPISLTYLCPALGVRFVFAATAAAPRLIKGLEPAQSIRGLLAPGAMPGEW
jgi:hypothetical protein